MENSDADALLDGKSATVNHSDEKGDDECQPNARRKHLAGILGVRNPGEASEKNRDANARSGSLKNWKHEEFARQVVAGTEPADAYVLAGFERNRANHHRLMRQPHMKDRIEVLRRERETAARAARVPISQVIEELDRRGFIRVEDFFDRNVAGIVAVRDLEMVPVEVSIAFLRALGEGFGIREK